MMEAEGEREFEDAALHALKTEEGSHEQNDVRGLGRQKEQGNRFSPELLEGTQPCRSILDFQPPDLYDNQCVLIKATTFVIIGYNHHKKQVRNPPENLREFLG